MKTGGRNGSGMLDRDALHRGFKSPSPASCPLVSFVVHFELPYK
jgi:hypothetical protein